MDNRLPPAIQPAFFKAAHRGYLNDLRESGRTNMFGAAPYLMADFPDLSKSEASSVLSFWMKTFKATA